MPFKETYLDYPDGTKVRIRINKFNNRTNAVLLHDIGERLEFFDYMFPYFDENDIALNAVELRGHGLSSGRKKSIDRYSDSITDLKRFVFGYLQNKPIYIIASGKSCITALTLTLDQRFFIKGIVLLSPEFDLNLHPAIKFFMPIISFFLPNYTCRKTHENFDYITNDSDNLDMIKSEAYRLGLGFNNRFCRTFLKQTATISRKFNLLRKYKTFLMLGEDDKIMNTQLIGKAFVNLFHETKNLQFSLLKNCRHSILLDKNKVDNINSIIKWIIKQEASK